MSYSLQDGEFLTNYIMDTGEVSRYTLLGTEALNENRMYYNKRYAVLMDWIAQNMDDERNDCLKCKSPTLAVNNFFELKSKEDRWVGIFARSNGLKSLIIN